MKRRRIDWPSVALALVGVGGTGLALELVINDGWELLLLAPGLLAFFVGVTNLTKVEIVSGVERKADE